jgi:uracil permease
MNELLLGVNEKPKNVRTWILLSLQHIAAAMCATILVPILTGLSIGSALISAGVGTIMFLLVTKRKAPIFLGSSFAYIGPIGTALTIGTITKSAAGFDGMNFYAPIIGITSVGILYLILGLIITYTGSAWVKKLLPKQIIGPVIMLIGLGLSSSAVNNVITTGETSLANLVIGVVSLVVTALIMHYGNKKLAPYPVLIGLGSGFALSLILSLFGYQLGIDALKIVDFSPFVNNNWNQISGWINTDLTIVRALNTNVSFSVANIVQILILFLPIALITLCEGIGDYTVVGEIIGSDLMGGEPGYGRLVIGDGVATVFGGLSAGCDTTSYGENAAVIGISKVASVWVIGTAALGMIFIGFFNPLILLIQIIPASVLGGICFILYGFIAMSGIKMIADKELLSINKNVAIISTILVAGLGGMMISFSFSGNDITISSTVAGLFLGILLNVITREKPKDDNTISEETVNNNTTTISK